MDLNLLLLWTALASTLALAVTVVRSWPHRRSWAVVALLLAAAAGAGWLVAPELAGYVAGGLWVALVLMPGLLLRAVSLAMQRQEYRRAGRLSTVLAALHPSRETRETKAFVTAVQRVQRGDLDGARELLAPRVDDRTPAGRRARVQLLRLELDWPGLVAYGRDRLEWSDYEADPALAAVWLRALGETGGRAALVQALRRFEPLFGRSGHQGLRDLGRLYLFAFTGRRAETEALLASRFAAMKAETAAYWAATAAQVAEEPAARTRLEGLANDPDLSVQRAVRYRIEHGPFASAPSEGEEALASEAARLLDQERRYGEPGAGGRAPAPATRGLAAAIVAAFAAEVWLGGSTDSETLLRLGAFWPPWVLEGEAWRLVAYQFLHFGPLHLTMNLLALIFLGRGVERALGSARFVVVYALAGTAGGTLALALTVAGWREPQLLVGASGGIMGLVGATVAILLRGHLRERAPVARRRLGGALVLVALQTAFDLATPQVSLFAHATGLVTGFVVASFLRHTGAEAPVPAAARAA